MIRNQLYISEDHERAFKARAREAGVSEAELMRRFLDKLLLGSEGIGRVPLGQAQAALDFLEATDEITVDDLHNGVDLDAGQAVTYTKLLLPHCGTSFGYRHPYKHSIVTEASH